MTELSIDFNDLTKKTYTYNLKNVNTIKLSNFNNFITDVTKISALKNTLTLTLANNKTIKLNNILNPNNIHFTGNYTKTLQEFYNEKFTGTFIPSKEKMTKVTGTVFDENIVLNTYNLSAKGLTVNAGAGNDTIVGSKNNDTITGGLGTDTIVVDSSLYANNSFGINTVKLTKDENLIIDLTKYNLQKSDLKEKVSVDKKDFVITMNDNSKIKLQNFITNNGVGDNGSVKILLKEAENANPEISVNLNEEAILSYKDDSFTKNKNNTAILKGTRLDEEVNISSSLKDYTKTLKMGKGTNTINISSNNFGALTLSEEKLNATNVINFKAGVDGFGFSKSGNDLIIFNSTSKLTISDYYKERTAKTKYANIKFQINGVEVPNFMDGKVISEITKGKIIGTDGDDVLISSTSNDNITGNKGTNRVVFNTKFGKDTINLTEGENLILDMSAFEDIADGHIKRTMSGDDLVLTVGLDKNEFRGTIVLKGFAKSDVTGNSGSITLRLNNGDIDLKNSDFDVRNVKSSYNGTRFNEYIDAWDAKKAITITGNKGDDYMVSSQYKPTTFVFNEGDGHDRITNSKKGDIIQINYSGEITYTNTGSDLIIRYGNGDTIQVDGYFVSDSRIDKIKIKNAQGAYETKSLAELTHLEEVKATIKNVQINGGLIEIPANSQYTTLNLVGINMLTHFEVQTGENEDDLYIAYGNSDDMIVLKDYVKNKGNHSIKYVTTNGQTYDVPQRYYLGVNDSIQASPIEEYIYLENGNHTVNFGVNNHFDNMPDRIYATGAQYTDTLKLTDYSFENGEIEIGRETSPTGSLTIDANDGKALKDGGRRNYVKYEHYFDGTTPLVKIQDKNGIIEMQRVEETSTLNWQTQEEANKDHYVFISNYSDAVVDEMVETIVSNTKRNEINSSTKGNTVINYAYKGGNDYIYHDGQRGSYGTDDTYNVDIFNDSTKLTIDDYGGYDNDTININANSEDIYIMFNASDFGLDNGVNLDIGNTAIIHKEAMTVETLKAYLSYDNYDRRSENIAGVISLSGSYRGAEFDEDLQREAYVYGSTIENVKTLDKEEGLDILEWKSLIAGRVLNWLKNNNSVEGKNLWFFYYSPVGVMRAVAEGKATLTDAQYESLLDCYKVKYSEIPQSKNFVSTTGNDTYNFGYANNRVTFNSATIGLDTINSASEEYNASYKDRLIFTEGANLSVKNSTLNVGVNGNDLQAGANEDNLVTYKNFVSDANHNEVILIDSSNDKYYINTVTSGSHFREGSNNIAFVYNDNNNNSVGGTTGRNFIYSYGEHAYMDGETEVIGGMWNCVYKNGEDKVVSFSENASDGYEVYGFSATSKLNVTDNGGSRDSLYIAYNSPSYNVENPIIGDMRLVFNVNSDGIIYNDFMLVHEDVLNGTTLHNTTQNDLVAGVLRYNATPTVANSFGIESFKYFVNYDEGNDVNNPYPNVRVDLDINAWTNAIVENVQTWLTSDANTAGYTSAYQAFANASSIDISGLVNCYDIDYTNLNQA